MINIQTIHELARISGGTLYLMALMLLVALKVSIERSWFLYRTMAGADVINQRIAALLRLERDLLQEELHRVADLPQAALLRVPLEGAADDDRDALAGRLEEALMSVVPRLDRSLWMLDTIVTLAPLMGLLGTIVGMFGVFSGLGQGAAAPAQVTSGVAEALVATAFGLFIAMLGLVALNALNNRVRLLAHALETLKQILLNRHAASAVGAQGGHNVSLHAVAA